MYFSVLIKYLRLPNNATCHDHFKHLFYRDGIQAFALHPASLNLIGFLYPSPHPTFRVIYFFPV